MHWPADTGPAHRGDYSVVLEVRGELGTGALPRSEWKIAPTGSWVWVAAMVTASQIRSVRMCSAIAQPIMALVWQSTTVANSSQPCQVGM